MSSFNDEVTPAEQLRPLLDRDEISRLCDRYVSHLDFDRDNDDWLGSVFTPDAQLSFPHGTYEGMTGLAAFQQVSREHFARSHHISSNHVVELDGDEARVRAHLVAVHVPSGDEPTNHFDIGGHYEAEVVRTGEGWRIRRFSFDLVWQDGTPPGQVSLS